MAGAPLPWLDRARRNGFFPIRSDWRHRHVVDLAERADDEGVDPAGPIRRGSDLADGAVGIWARRPIFAQPNVDRVHRAAAVTSGMRAMEEKDPRIGGK